MVKQVRALETAQWWDSGARKAHSVLPGDIVTFVNDADAEYFADEKRGTFDLTRVIDIPSPPDDDGNDVADAETVAVDTGNDIPPPHQAPAPKRGRKSKGHVQE